MNKIRLIEKGTDISRLEMIAMPWDVEINNIPYQVVIIKGYVHSIGGRRGENDLWMYPRGSKPTYENLVEYQCDGMGVCWGIEYKPYNYIKSKWDESECFTSGGAMITRNGKDFYFCRSGIDEARYLIKKINDHPINFDEYNFEKQIIGRKVWWRSEPAIITSWIESGQACVILEPDGIDHFKSPAEFVDDELMNDGEDDIKADIFDNHIWWFREDQV